MLSNSFTLIVLQREKKCEWNILYYYSLDVQRRSCRFRSHEEKQMSTKGAVMVFIVKNPIIRIEIYTYFIPLFKQQRNSIRRARETIFLTCICRNFMLTILKQACDNCFIWTAIGLRENPEYIHSLHRCCKDSCIRQNDINQSGF